MGQTHYDYVRPKNYGRTSGRALFRPQAHSASTPLESTDRLASRAKTIGSNTSLSTLDTATRIAKYYARGLVTRDPQRLEKRSVRSPPWGRHATGFTSHEMRLATITAKNQRSHLPWMESLARLSNTHGRVATRPPTMYAKNADRALPWSRKSTGLMGHGDR